MRQNIGRQLSMARTHSIKNCAFCGDSFEGIKIKHYCDESCKQKAKYQRNKERNELAGRKGVPLSQLVGTTRPYDWSNPDMPSKAFIVSVLNGGGLHDITRCVRYFGGSTVSRRLKDVEEPLLNKIATRKVGNAVAALEGLNASA